MTTIRLHNSMTRRVEPFTPLDPAHLRIYLCGPTVYDRAHVGNARPVIMFDVLYRLLRHAYPDAKVTYVRNFTDVDDKINDRAALTGRNIRDITDETIGWYHADMDALGALRPDHEPRATDYIAPMVAMIGDLIVRGHAYEVEGHVLFDVRSYPDYGRFSGRSVDDMIAGARVEVAPYKRDPMDFVLWKPSDAATPGWDSPWGRGRPGWHIECSAMAQSLLGPEFDIHGGGNDLTFPHHENEVAQSCCANPGSGFAKVWLHNEMLVVEGKKMSKSLGNFFTIRDLLDQGFPGEVIRLVFLGTHYRKQIDWTAEKAAQAEKRLDAMLPALSIARSLQISPSRKWSDLSQDIQITLSDDLNTAGAIPCLEASAGHLVDLSLGNTIPTNGPIEEAIQAAALAFVGALDLLGLYDLMLARQDRRASYRDQLDALEIRMQLLYEFAKASKDFADVDRFRETLLQAGLEVRISKGTVDLVPMAGFDPSRLEALE